MRSNSRVTLPPVQVTGLPNLVSPLPTHLTSPIIKQNNNFLKSQMLTTISKKPESEKSSPINPLNVPPIKRNSAIQNILNNYSKNGKMMGLMSTPSKGKKVESQDLMDNIQPIPPAKE